MRLAIVDRNRTTLKLLAECLEAQIFLSPEDRDKHWVLACATVQDALPLVPSLDAIWLEESSDLHQQIGDIRARSWILSGKPRPIIAVLINQPSAKAKALEYNNKIVTVEKNNMASFLASYETVQLLLKGEPLKPGQAFAHT